MLLKLKQLLGNSLFFIFVFLVHIVALQFVHDIKTLLFIVSSFVTFNFLLFDFSIKEVLFVALLFVFSFDKGIRGWDLVAVAQGREFWMHGFSLYYGVSLRSIIILLLFLISSPELFFYFRKSFNQNIMLVLFALLGFIVLAFVSTVFSSDYFLSFFGFLRILQAVFLFFITIIILQNRTFVKYFFLSIILVLFLNGYVGSLQHQNGGPIGWYLEDGAGYEQQGYLTSDGSESLYRASGLIGHPTFFASFVSMLLPFAIVFSIFSLQEKQRGTTAVSSICVLLGLLALYGSFVRSGWFSSLLFFIVFFLNLYFTERIFLKEFISKYLLFFIAGISSFLVLFGKRFWLRIVSTTEFLSDGSGVVRIALIEQALIMIKEFPLFGVGLNLSTRMMNEQSLLPPELRGFMFPVHNTFFLFFSELGIPSSVFFILFLLGILQLSFKYVKKNVFFGIWLGVVGFILNSQVHTLFNQDPSFDLLFLYLGVLTLLCMKKGKLL